MLFVPELPDDAVDEVSADDDHDPVVVEEEVLDIVDEEELDHVEEAELDPVVPSLLKLSGPQTASTSWPTFHFSGIRLLATAWKYFGEH